MELQADMRPRCLARQQRSGHSRTSLCPSVHWTMGLCLCTGRVWTALSTLQRLFGSVQAARLGVVYLLC